MKLHGSLLAVLISLLVVSGCTMPEDNTTPPAPETSSSPTPSPEPSPEEPPVPSPSVPSIEDIEELYPGFEAPDGFDPNEFIDEDGQFDYVQFLEWLASQPGYESGEHCNPLSPACLYDPLYGSCEWDPFRGVYACDGYHYRPGYDCYYDAFWGEYVCAPKEGGGW